MKKATFDHFLKEVTKVYLRIEDDGCMTSIISGGLNSKCEWVEFSTVLERRASLKEITLHLKVMAFVMGSEKKKWDLEQPYHRVLRQMNICSN